MPGWPTFPGPHAAAGRTGATRCPPRVEDAAGRAPGRQASALCPSPHRSRRHAPPHTQRGAPPPASQGPRPPQSLGGGRGAWRPRPGRSPQVRTRRATRLNAPPGRCRSGGRCFPQDDRSESAHRHGDRRDTRSANRPALPGPGHAAKTREHRDALPLGMRDQPQATEERRAANVARAVLEQR